MRMFLVAVAFLVIFPGVAFPQLAPQSQAEFEQRFTGWILQLDAPDCNDGEGIAPATFIGPGRFETNGFQGSYEYQGTGANTGTLTMRADIFPIPQVSNLTFNSQTMGTLTVEALGIACEGSFEFVESTPDTTPPSLVSVVVEDTGDQITLTFDEDVSITRNPVDGFDDPFSITADGQPVSRTGRVTFGNSIAFAGLSPVITSGQTVTVSYADPTPGDDEHGLHDRDGNDAASFTRTAVNHSTVESVPVPALPLAGVGLLGLLLVSLGGWVSRSRVAQIPGDK